MVKKGDVISLSKVDVKRLVENECGKRLHMSVVEFVHKRKSGELPNSTAVHDVELLLKLAKD